MKRFYPEAKQKTSKEKLFTNTLCCYEKLVESNSSTDFIIRFQKHRCEIYSTCTRNYDDL